MRGLEAEILVLNHFKLQGYVLKDQRKKTPFGEIDLWLYSEKHGHLLLEVKTLENFDYLGSRISSKQRGRLRRTWTWILEAYPQTHFLVAFVEPSGSILTMPLDLI